MFGFLYCKHTDTCIYSQEKCTYGYIKKFTSKPSDHIILQTSDHITIYIYKYKYTILQITIPNIMLYYYNIKRTMLMMDVISYFNVYYKHILFIFQVEGYIPPCSLVAIMGPRFVYKPKFVNKLHLFKFNKN